jgi:hypothetical protein
VPKLRTEHASDGPQRGPNHHEKLNLVKWAKVEQAKGDYMTRHHMVAAEGSRHHQGRLHDARHSLATYCFPSLWPSHVFFTIWLLLVVWLWPTMLFGGLGPHCIVFRGNVEPPMNVHFWPLCGHSLQTMLSRESTLPNTLEVQMSKQDLSRTSHLDIYNQTSDKSGASKQSGTEEASGPSWRHTLCENELWRQPAPDPR